MKQDQENHENQNIVPLGSDEIRSILKSQSESVFEDKNISNNSNFVKKSIIDIALANKERETPEYIQMDEKNKKLKFVRVPKFEEVPYPIIMEPNLVIEYYSR